MGDVATMYIIDSSAAGFVSSLRAVLGFCSSCRCAILFCCVLRAGDAVIRARDLLLARVGTNSATLAWANFLSISSSFCLLLFGFGVDMDLVVAFSSALPLLVVLAVF